MNIEVTKNFCDLEDVWSYLYFIDEQLPSPICSYQEVNYTIIIIYNYSQQYEWNYYCQIWSFTSS